jgi:O-methyltransferase involved in polyketide biosynthesis
MLKRKEKTMNQKEKISIKGVPETMLQTLYARAKESLKSNHYIYDKKAIEIVSQVDYDFSEADKDTTMASGVIARTIVLDRMVDEFLKRNPNAIVVNLACGMDTRCYRMQGRFQRWYNIDLPETMRIRELFLIEDGPIYQIAKSAMDRSYVDEIEYSGEPVLVIIEGLTMYLNEKDIRQIFDIIYNKFSKATIFVETMSPFVVKHIREKSIEKSQARFTWGVKNGHELHKLIPEFTNEKDISLVEGMQVISPVYRLIGKIPFIRNISNKILVMKKAKECI